MSKGKRKQQSFLQGAMILVGATALVKIVGAIFKIPLTNLIGASGMGYFSTAYDLYLPIYSLAMAGLPIAISRMVAERVVEKRYRDVRKTLRVTQRAFLVTGLLGFVIMLALSYPYILYVDNPGALWSIFAITPSLLFCCIMSSYRGYYEGLRNMYPTAVSSVIEALGKLFLGLGMAYLVILKAKLEFAASGTVFGKALTLPSGAAPSVEDAVMAASPYAAAAAILGITIGTALGALYLIIRHKRGGDKITGAELDASPAPESGRKTLRMLVAIAIPVVLGSLVTNVASLVDMATVQRQLSHAVKLDVNTITTMYAGLLPENTEPDQISNFLYGCYKGLAYSIYNLIPSLTSVLGVSALPVLAMAWTEKRRDAIKTNVESMIRITALVVLPAGTGIAVLSGPILHLLYSGRPGEASIAEPILGVLGVAALFSGLTAPLTNMLQAIGRQGVPVRNIAVGAVLKIVVNYVLVGIPGVNVIGASVGTAVCYFYIFVANLICLIRYSGVMPNLHAALVKPAVSALVCGAVAWGSCRLLEHYLGKGSIPTVLAILLAAAAYLIMLFCTRTVTKVDILGLPKGEKIAARLEKLGWIKP